MGAFTWLSWLNQCVIMYSPHHLAVCDSFCVLLKKKIQSQCVCTKWCAKTGVQIRINYCFISNKNNHNWLIIEEVNVNWKWNWNKETEMNSNRRRSSSCKKRKRNTKTTLIELYIYYTTESARDSWNVLLYTASKKWPCTIINRHTQKFNHEICKLLHKIGVIEFCMRVFPLPPLFTISSLSLPTFNCHIS